MDFNPALPNIASIINKYKHVLDMDTKLSKIIPSSSVFVSFRRARNILDQIVHSKLKVNNIDNAHNNFNIFPGTINNINKEGKCNPCKNKKCVLHENYLKVTDEFTSYHTTDKFKILDYIDANPNIKFVMDLHGWERERTGDVDLGTMNGESLESQVGECLPEIFAYIFEKWNIFTTIDAQFSASTNETVTKFIHEYIDEIVDAIQFEIENDYRSCSEDAFTTMIYALMEIIIVVNYLYELPTD